MRGDSGPLHRRYRPCAGGFRSDHSCGAAMASHHLPLWSGSSRTPGPHGNSLVNSRFYGAIPGVSTSPCLGIRPAPVTLGKESGLELYSLHGNFHEPVVVLSLNHLRHRIRKLDDRLCGPSPCEHQVNMGRPGRDELQDLLFLHEP